MREEHRYGHNIMLQKYLFLSLKTIEMLLFKIISENTMIM